MNRGPRPAFHKLYKWPLLIPCSLQNSLTERSRRLRAAALWEMVLVSGASRKRRDRCWECSLIASLR